MEKKLPAPPVDLRIETLPETLGGRYACLKQICAQMHQLGDKAAAGERRAESRREQRRLQTVNKLARAAAQGVEAGVWLVGVVDKAAAARGVPSDQRQALMLRASQDTMLLVDDLVFEAAVVGAYSSEPSKARK